MADGQEKQCAFDGCTKEALFREEYCWEHLPEDEKKVFKRKIEAEKKNLEGANLRGADLSGANLTDAKLSKADLCEVNLSGAEMWPGVDLSGANLWGADLSSAKLQGADLSAANLSAATLPGAELPVCNLSDANLTGANLTGCDLSRAVLSGASFYAGNLADSTLCWIEDFKGANFVLSRMKNADLSGSALLRRYIEDQNYLAEFREQRPILYKLWKISCDCGRNVWWWIGWSGFIVWFFGSLFLTFLTNSLEVSSVDNLFAAYYFSIVTFTTLGFGDVTPLTLGAQIAVVCEVILGYVMLGGLVSLLAVRLARRA